MCETEGHRFLSLLDYKYACAYKGCEAVWGNLCRENGLRAHLKEHHNISCNVCGHQLPKSDLWLRNFDQDLRKLGKHYDAHLMEDGGISVHGYRCRICNLRLNISVDTTSSCKDKCPNLKFRAIEYLDTTSCKRGTDFDLTVICPELTVVRDLPIKRPPETDGLGPEPREEAWRIRRRMYNGDSSDSDTASNQVPTDCLVTNTGESAADSSGGKERLGLNTDSDNILPNPEVRRKKKRKVLRKSKSRSDSYLKRKRHEIESEVDSDPPPTLLSRRRYIGGDALYKAYLRRKEGLPSLSEDSDSVESINGSPGFLMYARNEADPGKVRNKRRRSPIVISDESISGRSKWKMIRDRKKGGMRSNSSDQAAGTSDGRTSNTQHKDKLSSASLVLKNLPISSATTDKILEVLTKANEQRKSRRNHTFMSPDRALIRGRKVRSSSGNSTSSQRERRSATKRRRSLSSSSSSGEHSSIARSVMERRRTNKTIVYKARKSARITRSTRIVTISSEEDSEAKQRRIHSTLRKLGVSDSAQARIKGSVATLKKVPMMPKKKPRGKSGSCSCSATCSSSDSGNISKSKCSTCNSDSSDVKFPYGSRTRKGTPRIYFDESTDNEQSKRRKGQNKKINEIDLTVMLSSGDEDSRSNKRQVSPSVSTLKKLGISKNVQDKILASIKKSDTDNSKTKVSSKLKRKDKLTVSKPSSFGMHWRSTTCDSSSCSESHNSCSSKCSSHCSESSNLCTCSDSQTGNWHASCSSVELVSGDELAVNGKQMVTVHSHFEVSCGTESKLSGNKDGGLVHASCEGSPPLIVIE